MNTDTLLTNKDFTLFARLAIAAMIAIICAVSNMPTGVQAGLCTAAVLIAGLELILTVVKSIAKLKFFTEQFLMLIAIIFTLISGHYPEAVLSALLFRISEFLCEKLRRHALDMAASAGCSPDTEKKSRLEVFADKTLKTYVPAVVVAALLLAFIPMLFTENTAPWLARAAIVLMVCCPSALTFSVPLCSLFAIYRMSHEGVALNAVNAMEQLAAVNTMVLDRSDVISGRRYIISDVLPVPGLSSRNLLMLAAYAASSVNHPTTPILEAACGEELDPGSITGSEQLPGFGVLAHVKGLVVSAGNLAMMEKLGLSASAALLSTDPGAVHIAINGTYAGCVVIVKKPNDSVKGAIEGLKIIGIGRIVLFSGDSTKATTRSARELGIDEYFPELDAAACSRQLDKLLAETFPEETLAYVGCNSELLDKADIGIAVGETAEGCDAVLTSEDPGALVDATMTAKRGRSIILQGVAFAVVLKLVLLILTLLNIAPFWLAVLADSGVAILTVANAMRAGR